MERPRCYGSGHIGEDGDGSDGSLGMAECESSAVEIRGGGGMSVGKGGVEEGGMDDSHGGTEGGEVLCG